VFKKREKISKKGSKKTGPAIHRGTISSRCEEKKKEARKYSRKSYVPLFSKLSPGG